MLIKLALLFLIAMAGIAVWGRMRRQRRLARFCPDCGAPRAGVGRCPCGSRRS